MNNLTKLGIAIGIAVVAGVLNWVYLNSKDRPILYLALNDGVEEVDTGQQFPAGEIYYKTISVVGVPPQRLNTTLIPYDPQTGASLIYNARATRDVKPGDPIFFSDIAEDVPRYETLGPFTLLSVGNQFIGDASTDRSGGSGAVITLEPHWEKNADGTPKLDQRGVKVFDEQTRRLFQIVEAQRSGNRDAPSHLRIVAVEARPSSATAGPGIQLGGESPNARRLIHARERVIIVPIPKVESIPEVLRIGSEIAFVVPTYP